MREGAFITENFASWIVESMIDDLGRMVLHDEKLIDIKRKAATFNRRIERQVLPNMTSGTRNYFLQEHGHDIAFIRDFCDNI